jgi:hypothetical protein
VNILAGGQITRRNTERTSSQSTAASLEVGAARDNSEVVGGGYYE